MPGRRGALGVAEQLAVAGAACLANRARCKIRSGELRARRRAKSAVRRGRSRRPFRPTPPLPFRTHVPRADDTSTEQALASRAGARCRGNGTRVRDAGRGNARPRGVHGTGSPACPGTLRAAGRPHRRPPAPPTAHTSATRAPRRHRPPARPGLPHAGPSPGGQAGLTARRRPVWEDGSAGRPGALPGAPDFIASRAAPHRAARVLWAARAGEQRHRERRETLERPRGRRCAATDLGSEQARTSAATAGRGRAATHFRSRSAALRTTATIVRRPSTTTTSRSARRLVRASASQRRRAAQRRRLAARRPTTTTSRPAGRLVRRNRRRPTLPGPCEPSTIGAVGLNCSVRNGKRCFPHAIATGNFARPSAVPQNCTAFPQNGISIRQALDPLVPVSCERHRSSRSGLSTWWSTRGLTPSRGWESSSRGRLPA